MKPLVYLSGPIANCTLEEIHGWRDEFKGLYGHQHCVDPTRRIFGGEHDNWKKTREIIDYDLIDIGLAHVHLVYYTRPTCGTLMETVHAYVMNKFVIICVPDPMVKEQLSPWVIYHSNVIVESLLEAVYKIEEHYNGLVVA